MIRALIFCLAALAFWELGFRLFWRWLKQHERVPVDRDERVNIADLKKGDVVHASPGMGIAGPLLVIGRVHPLRVVKATCDHHKMDCGGEMVCMICDEEVPPE